MGLNIEGADKIILIIEKSFMNRLIVFSICMCFCLLLGAQELQIKSFNLDTKDTRASVNKREDRFGKKCAIIKVDVVGVRNLKFKDAIGNVDYSSNEYIVYVSPGTKKLSYSNGEIKGEVNIGEFMEIESLLTYRLVFDTDSHIRSAVFYIKPETAKLTIGPHVYKNNKDGIIVETRSGEHPFIVEAKGYIPYRGSVTLTDEELFETVEISLEQKEREILLNIDQRDALLYVDGQKMGVISELGPSINISDGIHDVRVTKSGYKDYTTKLGENDFDLNVEMKKMRTKVKVFSGERSKTSVSFRNHTDWMFTGTSSVDDEFKTFGLKILSPYFVQHTAGVLTFKEGFSLGAVRASKTFVKLYDKYYDSYGKDKEEYTLYVDIPFQTGISLPLNKYRNYIFTALGGAYGSCNYIGHGTSNNQLALSSDKQGKPVDTFTFDWGVRLNANFYLNKFIISFEADRSFANKGLGTFIGFGVGFRNMHK